jgi:hypothetical protein
MLPFIVRHVRRNQARYDLLDHDPNIAQVQIVPRPEISVPVTVDILELTPLRWGQPLGLGAFLARWILLAGTAL